LPIDKDYAALTKDRVMNSATVRPAAPEGAEYAAFMLQLARAFICTQLLGFCRNDDALESMKPPPVRDHYNVFVYLRETSSEHFHESTEGDDKEPLLSNNDIWRDLDTDAVGS
jgi:hypothetical protein